VSCSLAGGQTVELGADIGHTPGDHHAAYLHWGLTGFDDANDTQGSALCQLNQILVAMPRRLILICN
jgi:hypothetical protein